MKMKLLLIGITATMMFTLPAMAEEENALGQQMEAMNDAYKAMRRETDPAKGAALAREAQEAMVKALMETPELVKAMPEADQPKASAEYRKMIAHLISTLADMELAFLSNDMAKVQEIVKAMRDSKKEGHNKFMEDE